MPTQYNHHMEQTIYKRYSAAKHRLFLFDYDGTLVGFKPTPPEAKPTDELRGILAALATDRSNIVVIISGRDHETLESWLGDLPLAMVAEHGFFMKEDGNASWQMVTPLDATWKITITPLLKAAVSELPGSFIEEKVSALVWHYRNAAGTAVTPVVAQLQRQLEPLMATLGLLLVPGNKVIEVRLSGQDKGIAANYWLQKGGWDFILAAGDDTTDEDLFGVLPDGSFPLMIGSSRSTTRYRLANPEALLRLLDTLVQS